MLTRGVSRSFGAILLLRCWARGICFADTEGSIARPRASTAQDDGGIVRLRFVGPSSGDCHGKGSMFDSQAQQCRFAANQAEIPAPERVGSKERALSDSQ